MEPTRAEVGSIPCTGLLRHRPGVVDLLTPREQMFARVGWRPESALLAAAARAGSIQFLATVASSRPSSCCTEDEQEPRFTIYLPESDVRWIA